MNRQWIEVNLGELDEIIDRSTRAPLSESLKRWSGRRDSNPRRQAWEIDYTLTIKNMAFMASIASDSKSPIFNDLVQ